MGLMNRILHREAKGFPHEGAKAFVLDQKGLRRAEAVVRDYALATRRVAAAGHGCITDAAGLPHAKKDIKNALALVLRATDDPTLRERLKSSYLLLADWQDGVGEPIVPARAAGQGAGAGAWASWQAWQPKVLQDERALKAELQQLGLW